MMAYQECDGEGISLCSQDTDMNVVQIQDLEEKEEEEYVTMSTSQKPSSAKKYCEEVNYG